MLFVFGWGRRTRTDYGQTIPVKCTNCSNESYWHLSRMRTWFTLFFIPVIPYENKHVLYCSVCSNGVVLPSANVDRALELNTQTKRYLNQEITREEYDRSIDQSQILG